MEKINRMAENLGVDAMWKAAREHLIKIGEIPPDEPGEAKGEEADSASPPEIAGEAQGQGQSQGQGQGPSQGQSEASRWMSV